tara:strand:- start:737 stop:2179 length:1443 start_codon:yes stop_codon:yes gene_type:complete
MELSILFIEDNSHDVELTTRALIKGGLKPKIKVIDEFESVEKEVLSGEFDLVICDFMLGGFTGIDVLNKIKVLHSEIPVILVSGTVPDEKAIDAVLSGAKDYILKDNFTRLVPAVKREYEASVQRKEKKHIEEALSSSEEKYRQFVEASHDLVWRMDEEGQFNFVNSASQLILGYAPDEIKGEMFLKYVSQDQANYIESILTRVLNGETVEHYDLKMLKKNGSISYMTATSYPIVDNEGNVIGSSGAATDITHIKEYQQQLEETLREKEVLLKEIHHRVKNNLAVISGILGLQALHLTDEDMIATFEQSQSRIKSIAMIHEHLYQTELFTSVEIKSYVKELITEIKHTFERYDKNIEIEISGDEVQLNMNQAVPFGILANELITNALKFAFVGLKAGKIELELRQKDNRIFFSVSDDGIGLPEDFVHRKKKSLGMTLAETVISQLQGEFSWGQNQNVGTRFLVEFSRKEMNNWAEIKKLN